MNENKICFTSHNGQHRIIMNLEHTSYFQNGNGRHFGLGKISFLTHVLGRFNRFL